MKELLPTAASFLISEDCNLACKYCFELIRRNKKHMSSEVAVDAVNYLYENAIKNLKYQNNEEVGITLFGGEPFLKPDIIDDVVNAALKARKETGINFNVGAITNGTILNDDIINQYKRYNDLGVDFSIQLSVDSIKELNDENRVTKAGKGTFDIIEKNIEGFKEIFGGSNFHETNKRNFLHVHGSLNNVTIHKMYESYLFFRDVWKIPAIWFMPIVGSFWKDEDADTYYQQLKLISDEIKSKLIETNDLKWLDDYAPLNRALDEKPIGMGTPCGAGKNYCTITASGEIYVCHQFYFHKDYNSAKLGTIYEGIDDERARLLKEYGVSDMYCVIDKDCDAYNCYRCIAENWDQTGSILSTLYNSRCMMSRHEKNLIEDMRNFINEAKNGNICHPRN